MKLVFVNLLLMCLIFHFVASKIPQPIQTEIAPKICEILSIIPDVKNVLFWSIQQLNDKADGVISALIDKNYSLTINVGEKLVLKNQFELIIIVEGKVS